MKKLPILIIILLILSILIFINSAIFPIKFLSSIVQSAVSAPKSFFYNLKAGGNSEDAEVAKVKKENQQLSQKLINYNRVMRDNQALRSQFETTQTHDFSLLPARILGFEGSLFSPATLVIDKGSRDNIKNGMGVVSANNLVGKVTKVLQNYSTVTLVVNDSFKTLAKTSDNSSAGVAHGGSDFIIFERVNVSDNISKSKILVTSGDINDKGIGIPPDLVIGKILSVNRSPSLPFQTAKIQPVIDFGRLEMVFIVERY